MKKSGSALCKTNNPDVSFVGLELPAEFVEFLRQNVIEKIYRRVIDGDECNPRLELEPETVVNR